MEKLIVFGIISIPIIYFSSKPLLNFKSHGFYRFFGWEGIAWLLSSNYKYWFYNPLSVNQIFSWILLVVSILFVMLGYIQMREHGKASHQRDEKELYGFEKTTELVNSGIFHFIRHPLYGSLIYLTVGVMLKNPNIELILISIISTIFFYLTMKVEERENRAYFGDKYSDYMKKTKMFIPYIL